MFIPRTVLLETEWVLRARYGKSREDLLAFFRALLATENTILETPEAVALAVDWYGQGADFADALHLATCGNAVMHTFDRGFCKQARTTGAAPGVHVWET
ncbi:type II toxin-antitoxin system VapC family toxin [Thiorhodococcus minor]|uniref:type II toxin-antitoxin system VapC family toxin n=1 Tax=Thiorhodococcus minor TaxID=57489 RepID=UPI003158809D